MAIPKPTPQQIQQALADTAEAQKVAEARPTWGDLKAAFKREPAPDKDGVLNLKVEGKRELALLGEMMRPAWRRESERGSKKQAEIPRVALKDEQGRIHNVREDRAEQVARKKRLRKHAGRTFGYSRAYSEAPYWSEQ